MCFLITAKVSLESNTEIWLNMFRLQELVDFLRVQGGNGISVLEPAGVAFLGVRGWGLVFLLSRRQTVLV